MRPEGELQTVADRDRLQQLADLRRHDPGMHSAIDLRQHDLDRMSQEVCLRERVARVPVLRDLVHLEHPMPERRDLWHRQQLQLSSGVVARSLS